MENATRQTWLSFGLVLLAGPVASAQQIVEIDLEAGRTIIDDEWRSMYTGMIAVDWDRDILYVEDDEEPEGIMAFSLETGEWIRTISTPEGDGPREFPQGAKGMEIAPGGGLYVSGYIRVIEYDPEAIPLDSWRPEPPSSGHVCNFGGAPAVPTYEGVVRRGPEGTSEGIGPGQEENLVNPVSRERLRRPEAQWTMSTRIVCSEDAAYVVMTYDEGPDSVFVFHRSGEVGLLPVPAEGAIEGECMMGETRGSSGRVTQPARPCPHWSLRAHPSLDDLGNVVLLGHDSRTSGAIIDPETGCHALVRAAGDRRFAPA
ncbi:MAG: hypothetical protein OXF01_12345, partial [Gemmatimonadetes bacterium]|nr:hypothetical protein [Gemmatimonadota bacterium]